MNEGNYGDISLPLTCHACGLIDTPILRPQGPHIGAYCPGCARWITWLKKPKPDWRQLPATEQQLSFLDRPWEDRKTLTRGAASDLIAQRLQVRS